MSRNVKNYRSGYLVNGQLIQSDYDYPGVVQSLGYGLVRRGEKCRHNSTDGTVDCKECGKTASQFIYESAQILETLAW